MASVHTGLSSWLFPPQIKWAYALPYSLGAGGCSSQPYLFYHRYRCSTEH